MYQPSPQQFVLNSRQAKSDDANQAPDRQRGMWSFLTWSFFLAQAVAAHEAYARGVATGEGDTDWSAHEGAGNGASNGGAGLASPLGVDGFNIDPAAAAKLAAAVAAGLLSPEALQAMQADPAQFEAFVKALFGEGGIQTAASASDVAGETAGQVPSDPALEGPGGDSPGIHLPIDIAIDLGLEVGSALDLGLSLDNGLGIHLDLNTAPISLAIDTSQGLDVQLDLLGIKLGLGSGDGLGHLLAMDGDTGGPLLTSTLDAVQAVTALTSDVLDLPVVGSAVGAVGDVAETITTTATEVVGDVMDFPVLGSLVSSAGSIIHPAGPLTALNELVGSAGQHTEYAIELQTTSTAADAGEASLALSSSADDLAATLDIVAGHDSTLSSLMESLHLKGLGDGLT